MLTATPTCDDLATLTPRHDSLVGIDSDGCVFNTMEEKQCRHFHPLIIRFWHLEVIEPQLRAVAEFVNLYSIWRGKNRYPNLLKVFELLAEWDEVTATGITLPDLVPLRDYVNSGLALGTPSLEAEVARTGSVELARVQEWSRAVNNSIDNHMPPAPPFAGVREALEQIRQCSDAIVVSQTPEAALMREWKAHELTYCVQLIAGQELGTKTEHLQLAAGGKYDPDRVLLLGDAPGDRQAAHAAGASFYPINPGDEAASWQRFIDEAYPRFLAGTYAGEYQAARIAEFESLLPSTPPWRTATP
jgi:phosphoglycolate phosphatase-like HAD superfamily hydrolase